MKTLILIMIIYFIISKLRPRSHQGSVPRPQNSGYRTANDEEMPLSGPWDLPEADEDAPLSGPWNRTPQDMRTEPLEPKAQHELPEKKDAGVPKQFDQRERAENTREETHRDKQIAAILSRSDDKQQAEPQLFHAPRKKHQNRNDNPLVAALNSRSALVGSIVLGEVLGSRGGKGRR